STGDIVINGVPVGPTLASFDTSSPSATGPAGSAIAKAEAINRVADQSGVRATVNATLVNATTINTALAETGSFDLNGVTIEVSYSATNTVADKQNSIISAINNKAGQTGIRAEALGPSFRLVADDGRNIQISNIPAGGLTTAQLGLADSTNFSSIALTSA